MCNTLLQDFIIKLPTCNIFGVKKIENWQTTIINSV